MWAWQAEREKQTLPSALVGLAKIGDSAALYGGGEGVVLNDFLEDYEKAYMADTWSSGCQPTERGQEL